MLTITQFEHWRYDPTNWTNPVKPPQIVVRDPEVIQCAQMAVDAGFVFIEDVGNGGHLVKKHIQPKRR